MASSPIHVVIVHGFTGSPASFSPQIEAFQARGYELTIPLLAGHGTTPEDLATKTYADWLLGVESCIEGLRLEPNVFLMGLSMGGTLVCDVLGRLHHFRGAVLVNPLVVSPDQSYVDMISSLIEGGTEFAPSIGSDIKKEGALETSYDATPLRAARSLFGGVKALEGSIGAITTPILLFSSEEDHVVPSESGLNLKNTLGDLVDRRVLKDSYHVATLDNDAQTITEESIKFFESLSV